MNQFYPPDETILEECITAIYDQGKSIEECLSQYPEERERLEPVLRLTSQLQAAKQLEAPSDYRIAVRSQLDRQIVWLRQDLVVPRTRANGKKPTVPIAPVTSSPRPTASRMVRPSIYLKFAVGLAVVALLLVLSTTASAMKGTLPGDSLYSMKRSVEDIQLLLAPSDAGDAALHARFADERLAELKQVAAQETKAHLDEVNDLYTKELSALQTYIESNSLTKEQKTDLAIQLKPVLLRHEQELKDLLDLLPDHVKDLKEIIEVLDQLYETVLQYVPNPVPVVKTLVPTLQALPTYITTAMPVVESESSPTHMATAPEPLTQIPGSNATLPSWWPESWPTAGYEEGEQIHTLPPPAQTIVATVIPDVLTAIPPVLTAIPPVLTAIPDLPDLPDLPDPPDLPDLPDPPDFPDFPDFPDGWGN